MEEDETTEWWFMIAKSIGGRTVGELQRDMDQREFIQWTVYLGREAYQRKLAAEGPVT